MKLAIAALVVAGLFTSYPVINADKYYSRADTPEVSTNYKLNVPATATVGDALVRVKEYSIRRVEQVVYRPSQSAHIRQALASFDIFPSDVYRAVGEIEHDGQRFTVISRDAGSTAFQLDQAGRLYPKAVNPSMNGGYIQIAGELKVEPRDLEFVRDVEVTQVAQPTSLNYEIVYNGTDGQALHFTYREYTKDDLARPAFSQDLAYPAASKTIRFRRLVIQVDALTDDQITYRVVADR